jgi:hypothetical protein
MKTTETTEAMSSHPGETRLASQKSIETPPVPKKNQRRTEKGLANLWSREKITKKARAGRGQETKWEMSA